MSKIVKPPLRVRGTRLPSGYAGVAAVVGGALKDLYDPIAEATVPLRFGRTLGWLYFVTSGHGDAHRGDPF